MQLNQNVYTLTWEWISLSPYITVYIFMSLCRRLVFENICVNKHVFYLSSTSDWFMIHVPCLLHTIKVITCKSLQLKFRTIHSSSAAKSGPSLQPLSPAPSGGSQGVLRPDDIYNISSVFWLCPSVYIKEQRFYSELSSDVQTLLLYL